MPDRADLTAGWDAAQLAERLGVRVVGHAAVGSTMDAAASDRGPKPVVHVAERQAAGRGRRGRRWASPPGNLYATVVWRDPDERLGPGLLAAIGVGWAEAVRSAGGPAVVCKWPNDGLLEGRKWAGLLARRAGAGALHVGLGANLEAAPDGVEPPAMALADRWPGWPGRREVGGLLLAAAVAVLREGGPGVRARLGRWAAVDAWAPGTPIEVRREGSVVRGEHAGLDLEGRLLVATAAGLEAIEVGDAARARRCPSA